MGTDLLRESLDKVKFIQEKPLAAQNMQKEYEDTMGMETTLFVGIQFFLMRICLMRRSLLLS